MPVYDPLSTRVTGASWTTQHSMITNRRFATFFSLVKRLFQSVIVCMYLATEDGDVGAAH
jgi:hypothetical protein